jgi:murein DD-endopeptidase MepM/ murein hydrolase activator NlpD
MSGKRKFTVMVVPEGGREARSYTVSSRTLKVFVWGAIGFLFVVSLLVGSWWYLAARAQQALVLEAELARVYVDRDRLNELVVTLREVEEGYDRLRGMFAPGPDAGAAHVWLPSATAPRAGQEDALAAGETTPTAWPLSETGVVTRALLEGAGEAHPGLDIAVPTGSYIRASGAGVVVEEGSDSVYGLYVILDHGEGYRTLYAHASLILVEEGRQVSRNEVIGLTGSTGRSSAPHLHFEIQRDGEPIDPLTMVTQP